MSKLGHLIEQARKTRPVTEMFKAQPLVSSTGKGDLLPEILQIRLSDLEQMLFDNPYLEQLPTEDIAAELEAIARDL